MHVHILGICGTFMGSLAQLAKALGHRVTGADVNVYPPMSHQLEQAGIELIEGFSPEQLSINPDLIVVGNVVSRGNPVMEEVLNRGLPYTSGPEWLYRHLLQGKWVLGVAGTHGKTTTSSMLAWVLEYCGYQPGFLIGGVPKNFPVSARLGRSDFFVIEADEYDTAFFDKRSKFVHYQPKTLIVNNLEFDHADIFTDLSDIQRQFHHLLRTLPNIGKVIYPDGVPAINEVIQKGCWSERDVLNIANGWQSKKTAPDGSGFDIVYRGKKMGEVSWALTGDHNVANGLAVAAAANHVGILPSAACNALSEFKGVKRRMELVGNVNGIKVYDDFAHHPTAIAATLQGLRANVGCEPIWAVLEPRSNTMKKGVFKQELKTAIASADKSFWLQADTLSWDLHSIIADERDRVFSSVENIVGELVNEVNCMGTESSAHIVIMSNGSFDGIYHKLLRALEAR